MMDSTDTGVWRVRGAESDGECTSPGIRYILWLHPHQRTICCWTGCHHHHDESGLRPFPWYALNGRRSMPTGECSRNARTMYGIGYRRTVLMHWCIESLGPRYAASVACLLGCVYNGRGVGVLGGEGKDELDVINVRECEGECILAVSTAATNWNCRSMSQTVWIPRAKRGANLHRCCRPTHHWTPPRSPSDYCLPRPSLRPSRSHRPMIPSAHHFPARDPPPPSSSPPIEGLCLLSPSTRGGSSTGPQCIRDRTRVKALALVPGSLRTLSRPKLTPRS